MNAITAPEHYSGPIECIDAIRAALQAKIDRQRSQLRSRGGHLTLIPDIQKWQRATFPDADACDYLAKLREEIMELEATMDGAGFSNPGEELADIAICVIGLAQALDIALLSSISAKFEVNKARTWAKDTAGNYHHID